MLVDKTVKRKKSCIINFICVFFFVCYIYLIIIHFNVTKRLRPYIIGPSLYISHTISQITYKQPDIIYYYYYFIIIIIYLLYTILSMCMFINHSHLVSFLIFVLFSRYVNYTFIASIQKLYTRIYLFVKLK